MPINIHKRHHKMVGDNKRTPLIVKAIQQKIKKGDVIFEIGCGTGELASRLAEEISALKNNS